MTLFKHKIPDTKSKTNLKFKKLMLKTSANYATVRLCKNLNGGEAKWCNYNSKSKK